MSFLGLFTGAKAALQTAETGAKIVETAVNGVVRAGDALFYTQEEKAQAAQKGHETVLEFWKTFQVENSEQSKARREIANMFVLMFAGVLGLGVGFILIGDAGRLDKLLALLGALGFAWIIGCIITTYFAPYQLSRLGIFQGKKEK